jgi:F-type H+-transporting ATPase subunit alpha
VVEILKQLQYSPFPVEDQVQSIWAVTNGYMDDVPLDKVGSFEAELLDHLRSRHSGIGDTIRDSGKLEEDLIQQLKSAVEDFKQSWAAREEPGETTASEAGVPDQPTTPAAAGAPSGE